MESIESMKKELKRKEVDAIIEDIEYNYEVIKCEKGRPLDR